MPTLVLLPLLNRGLEEYALDDALENLTDRDIAEKLAGLSVLPPADLREKLLAWARARWTQKVAHARQRIGKLGAVAALHHAALEVLGYRLNRAPMLATAARHPLAEWGGGMIVAELYRENDGTWQTRGVRPANHPMQRLRQYAAWVERVPDWPQAARRLLGRPGPGTGSAPVAQVRRQWRIGDLRARVATEVTGGALTGSRLDNLVCDGLLPLLAADSDVDLLPLWFNWFVGDVPREVRRGLTALGLAGPGAGPLCHGWAQGLLAWIIERDGRASG